LAAGILVSIAGSDWAIDTRHDSHPNMIGFYCCHCAQHIDAPDEMGGTMAHCPTCGGEIHVPVRRVDRKTATIGPPPLPPIVPAPPPPPVKPAPPSAPASSPAGFYSPYEPPPLFQEEKGARQGLGGPGRIAIGSLLAWGICFAGARWRSISIDDLLAGIFKRGPKEWLLESLVSWVFVAFIALVLGAILAGILAAFRKPFGASLMRAYSLGVVLLSLGFLIQPTVKWLSKPGTSASTPPPAMSPGSEAPASVKSSPSRSGTISEVPQQRPNAAPPMAHAEYQSPTSPPAAPKEDSRAVQEEKIRKVVAEYLAAVTDLGNQYDHDLSEAGLERLFVPDRMAKDKDFKETTAIAAKVRVVSERYRSHATAIFDEFPRRVEASGFGRNTNAIVAAYNLGLERVRPTMKQMWALEGATMDRVDDVVEHLVKTRKHWAVENGLFVFERTADLNHFQELLEDMQQCAAKEEQLRKESATDYAQWMKTLKLPE